MASLLSGLFGATRTQALGPGEESVATDEDAIAAQMVELIKTISLQRARDSGGTVRRFNQPKSHGCLAARLEVGVLPAELAQGVFATPASYPATVRFANATADDDRKADLRGFSIKVQGLADGAEQHFLFNSHPALFAADPPEFLDFIRATASDRVWWFFLTHPGAARVVLRARDKPPGLFHIPYWSTTPSRFGDDPHVAVKHAVLPCADQPPPIAAGEGEHHHAERMRAHLASAPACFDFMVQFQTDPRRMPIEDASVTWPESESPLRPVGRIVIEQQDWQGDEAMRDCERMCFNPWTGLAAHRPLGGINRVRERVYREMCAFRNAANEQATPRAASPRGADS